MLTTVLPLEPARMGERPMRRAARVLRRAHRVVMSCLVTRAGMVLGSVRRGVKTHRQTSRAMLTLQPMRRTLKKLGQIRRAAVARLGPIQCVVKMDRPARPVVIMRRRVRKMHCPIPLPIAR